MDFLTCWRVLHVAYDLHIDHYRVVILSSRVARQTGVKERRDNTTPATLVHTKYLHQWMMENLISRLSSWFYSVTDQLFERVTALSTQLESAIELSSTLLCRAQSLHLSRRLPHSRSRPSSISSFVPNHSYTPASRTYPIISLARLTHTSPQRVEKVRRRSVVSTREERGSQRERLGSACGE